MRSHITFVVLLALAGLSGCVHKDVPVEYRLADCTNSSLQFQMVVQDLPPYQFVLGMPLGMTVQMSFRGEIVVGQRTGMVARIPISSDVVTPCNWLAGHSGYLLTWGRTNSGERLVDLLTRGQPYDEEVRFSERPSDESSFWFSAMRRVGL